MMHGPEKSDPAIVATKLANKAERSAAEPVERRAGTKGNASQQSTSRTQSRTSVSQALERIRKVARERKKERFTALFHHINTELLGDAFFELSQNAAPGVDRLTWRAYEADLERNVEDLHERVQRGAYRALPSRRVYIPKPDGRQRPLAVAALEDKIVQRAVATLLNAIYEGDFLGLAPRRGSTPLQPAISFPLASPRSPTAAMSSLGLRVRQSMPSGTTEAAIPWAPRRRSTPLSVTVSREPRPMERRRPSR